MLIAKWFLGLIGLAVFFGTARIAASYLPITEALHTLAIFALVFSGVAIWDILKFMWRLVKKSGDG